MQYQLAIIGGGPGGYTAAFKAVENGLSVILFEKNKIGGTCLNRGCIPTKSLLHSANQFASAEKMAQSGITAELSYDYQKILDHKTEIVTTLRTGVEKGLKTKKITVINGEASIISKHTISCNDETYEAENILICTGSKVSIPPIEGIEYAVTSDDILENDCPLYDHLTIIGGGVIGVEIASVYLGLKKKVTILEMADHLLPNMDKELAQRLNMFLKKQGAEIVTKASVKKVEKTDDKYLVSYQDKNGKEITVESDQVLCATGRRANLDHLFQGVSVEINRGIVTNDHYQTSIENIYAIGDCRANTIQLAHVAMAQAENVIDVILNKEKTKDESIIPSCVYTTPEIASVGLTETQAKEKGISVQTKKTLTGANGKCLIEQSESGYVKLVINKDNNQIIGAQLICPDATNIIAELAVAIQKQMTVDQLKEVIHPHPTIVEMIGDCL